jgi:predicted branched-subunit amino acid permease
MQIATRCLSENLYYLPLMRTPATSPGGRLPVASAQLYVKTVTNQQPTEAGCVIDAFIVDGPLMTTEVSVRHQAWRGLAGYRAGARAGLPFALVAGVVAISFGVLARSLGWGVLAPIVFSVITFSVAAQLAVAAVLGAGGGAFAAVAAAVLLNARFLPMGVAVAPFLKGGPLRRALEGQAILTTSWALASRDGGRFDREFMIGATVPQYVAWVVGTAVGVMADDVVGDVERLGLDVIFPAFFLALLMRGLGSGGKRTIAATAIAAALAAALVPTAPPGVPVLAACVAALLGLLGRSS